MEKKRAHKLIAINSHTDLFSSAAYLCMQQQTMSVQALSRLLEAVAKSIKHAAAMSTILATEVFQARHDAVLATSKGVLGWCEGVLCHRGVQLILAYYPCSR